MVRLFQKGTTSTISALSIKIYQHRRFALQLRVSTSQGSGKMPSSALIAVPIAQKICRVQSSYQPEPLARRTWQDGRISPMNVPKCFTAQNARHFTCPARRTLVARKKVDSLPCSGTSARAHLCRAGRLGEVWAADNTVLAGWAEAAGSLDRFCATTMTLSCVGEQAIVASLWTEKHAYSAQKQSILELLKGAASQHSIREAAGVSPSACY